jgi:hypothetical protein
LCFFFFAFFNFNINNMLMSFTLTNFVCSDVKDPEEVAEYLRLFVLKSENKSEGNAWRFNKSTQSWLLRHMYIKDKVGREGCTCTNGSAHQRSYLSRSMLLSNFHSIFFSPSHIPLLSMFCGCVVQQHIILCDFPNLFLVKQVPKKSFTMLLQ